MNCIINTWVCAGLLACDTASGLCAIIRGSYTFAVWLYRNQFCGEFNNASAFKRSLYWCQALHITNKDRYQSTSARRALTLLNLPLVNTNYPAGEFLSEIHFRQQHVEIPKKIPTPGYQTKFSLLALSLLTDPMKHGVHCFAR